MKHHNKRRDSFRRYSFGRCLFRLSTGLASDGLSFDSLEELSSSCCGEFCGGSPGIFSLDSLSAAVTAAIVASSEVIWIDCLNSVNSVFISAIA
jgi:hypothetical protein